MLETSFHAMGSTMRALVDRDDAVAARSLACVPGWFAAWERTFSRFDPGSELSRLNAHGVADVSPELFEVVALAVRAARASDGLVTPTVLGALLSAGYDRSFERLQDCRSGAVSHAPVPDIADVSLDAGARRIRLRRGATLDLSGFVKGWAADRAAALLGVIAPALVDAAGDVRAAGAPPGGWRIAVDDGRPRAPGVIALRAGGVATSGRDFRVWRAGGVLHHHLIDPRSGRPSESDVRVATVIAPTASRAEIAAKQLLLLGAARGLAWIDGQPELVARVVIDSDRVLTSERFPALESEAA